MGGCTFSNVAKGKTAQEAFQRVVREAKYEYGNGGYTGTIAEKREFKMITIPASWEGTPANYANKLIDDGDSRIDDKWGPAGCIELEPGKFLFFGWASS